VETVTALEEEFLRTRDFKSRLRLYARAAAIYPFENWQVKQIRCNLEVYRYEEAMEIYNDTMELYARELGSPPTAEMQECFERISLISMSSIEKERKYPVKVSIEIGKTIISCTNQAGDAKEEILVSTEGKNVEAGFNPKYFLDALKVIDDEEIFVDFGSSISPCIIRPVNEDGSYIYMILPIKIQD